MKGNGVGVLEVIAALQSGDEEGLLVGGFEKNPRTDRLLDARPKRNKTPRRKKAGPLISKEEVEMKEDKVPVVVATQARQEFEICSLCGFFNKSVKTENGERFRYLVCRGCNDEYLLYAKKIADELAAGQKPKVLSKVEWVLSQLDLERFERELEAARKTRTNAGARIDEKVRVTTNGKPLPLEVFTELRARYRQEISREDYFLVRRLFARLEAARKLKPELEQTLAQEAVPVATP